MTHMTSVTQTTARVFTALAVVLTFGIASCGGKAGPTTSAGTDPGPTASASGHSDHRSRFRCSDHDRPCG